MSDTELESIEKRMSELETVWLQVRGQGKFAEPPKEKVEHPVTEVPDEFSDRFFGLMPSRADIPLLAAGVGAASADGVASYISGFIPATGFFGIPQAALAKLAGGWALYKLGTRLHPLASAAGGGVFISAVADLAKQFGLYLKPKAGAATTATTTTFMSAGV